MNSVTNRRSTASRPARRPISLPKHRPGGGRQVDEEELARLVSKAKALPAVRRELVERIRQQIQAGTYETPEKLDTAIERMLEEEADFLED